jgi:hypothetical protein
MDMFHVAVGPPMVWTCLAANVIVGGEKGQDPLHKCVIIIILIDELKARIVPEEGGCVVILWKILGPIKLFVKRSIL